MAEQKLSEYRRKRDATHTAEPMPPESMPADSTAAESAAAHSEPAAASDELSFVIQEHHASSLHWDFRLERDGVLVSWAVPKGVPTDPKINHLAVHVEDHPLDYGTFEGHIAEGQYGGGDVTVWDHGTYRTEKWTDREVKVVLHGGRVQGRFVLFATHARNGKDGKNWMIHRMDAPPREDWQPLPKTIEPMLATLGALPAAKDDAAWAYEMKWDGVRAVVHVDGGRVRIMSRNDRDVSVSYPELRGLGEQLGSTQAVLDGEIVSFDDDGRPSFGRLQQRMHVTGAAQARRLAGSVRVVFLAFDVMYLDGTSLLDRPYEQRRELLERLDLDGPAWQTPPAFHGDGSEAVRASREQHLEGVVAKRLTSAYRPGRRSPDWVKIKNIRTQEVVIGGWRPGQGRRAGTVGSLLMGIPGEGGLRYCGHVGTGFTAAMLDDLAARLARLERKTSPFVEQLPRPDSRDAHWVSATLVGEVAFTEWTGDHRLRHPSWRGLRPDKAPDEVVRES